jgi:hypothetical protein
MRRESASAERSKEAAQTDALKPCPFDLAALAAVLAPMGLFLVPARIDNMWYDPEFTGWVAPLARRVAEGQRLYADGGHLPMPPLSILFMAGLFGHEANWLDESLVNFVFQCGIIAAGYLTLSRWMPRPIPLVAALASAGTFLALPKSIFYDSLAEFMSAAGIFAAGLAIDSLSQRDFRRALPACAAFGALTAATLLSKQSTGLGLAAGALIVLARIDGPRLRCAGWFAGGLCAGAAALTLAISPWVALDGLVQDVFVTGGEPKLSLALGPQMVLRLAFIYAGAVLCRGALPLFSVYAATGGKARLLPFPPEMPAAVRIAPIAAALAMAACLFMPLWFPPAVFESRGYGTTDFTERFFMPMGAALATGLALRALVLQDRPGQFGLLCLAALAAAAGHNLSDLVNIHFSYDNNMIVMLALASLLAAGAALMRPLQLGAAAAKACVAAGCFAAVFAGWQPMVLEALLARKASVTAAEIPYLQGARLRPEAAGLRALARTIARRTSPADSVLLLPEDIDLEAWWGRPRPRLSGAIIFSDLYWKRYVDHDFAILARDPPKLIVIGPRNFWPHYSNRFGGADALLIQKVRNELLPRHYRLLPPQKIDYQFRPDFMDIYLRVDTPKPSVK